MRIYSPLEATTFLDTLNASMLLWNLPVYGLEDDILPPID